MSVPQLGTSDRSSSFPTRPLPSESAELKLSRRQDQYLVGNGALYRYKLRSGDGESRTRLKIRRKPKVKQGPEAVDATGRKCRGTSTITLSPWICGQELACKERGELLLIGVSAVVSPVSYVVCCCTTGCRPSTSPKLHTIELVVFGRGRQSPVRSWAGSRSLFSGGSHQASSTSASAGRPSGGGESEFPVVRNGLERSEVKAAKLASLDSKEKCFGLVGVGSELRVCLKGLKLGGDGTLLSHCGTKAHENNKFRGPPGYEGLLWDNVYFPPGAKETAYVGLGYLDRDICRPVDKKLLEEKAMSSLKWIEAFASIASELNEQEDSVSGQGADSRTEEDGTEDVSADQLDEVGVKDESAVDEMAESSQDPITGQPWMEVPDSRYVSSGREWEPVVSPYGPLILQIREVITGLAQEAKDYHKMLPGVLADNTLYGSQLRTIEGWMLNIERSLGDTSWFDDNGTILSVVYENHRKIDELERLELARALEELRILRQNFDALQSSVNTDVESIDTELDNLHEVLKTMQGEMTEAIRQEVQRIRNDRAGRPSFSLPATGGYPSGSSQLTYDTPIRGLLHEPSVTLRDVLQRLVVVEESLKQEIETRKDQVEALERDLSDVVARLKTTEDGYKALKDTVASSGGVAVLASSFQNEGTTTNTPPRQQDQTDYD
ncbi:hypothetical protein THAOC_16573 [Thalassiosira oceanica]|uniref:Uncharacterized protein n=1 Tax=Thalassiosira oceanica TaxID=159749 RepID=K0SBV6_THAOC|nr:hypothetical protein THAOC_16573 [Thalassiosira oceanica]|eukprot:EJK62800.1 hypothetical protein THAOC_16573 [Thalassiosira oceanica]